MTSDAKDTEFIATLAKSSRRAVPSSHDDAESDKPGTPGNFLQGSRSCASDKAACFWPWAFFYRSNVLASQAGFELSAFQESADPEPIPVALFYPTQAPERTLAMGPFTVHAAMGGAPDSQVKGLIALSHGHGGLSSRTQAWLKRWHAMATRSPARSRRQLAGPFVAGEWPGSLLHRAAPTGLACDRWAAAGPNLEGPHRARCQGSGLALSGIRRVATRCWRW